MVVWIPHPLAQWWLTVGAQMIGLNFDLTWGRMLSVTVKESKGGQGGELDCWDRRFSGLRHFKVEMLVEHMGGV